MRKKIIVFMMLLIIPLSVSAADNSFSVSCDQNKISVNGEIICRTSIKSDFNYNNIIFNLTLSDGLEYEDLRSNYDALWQLTKKENLITASTKKDALQSGLQEFGIILLKAKKSGTQKITINGIKIKNTVDNKDLNLDDVSSDIKVISNDNSLENIKINGKDLENFDSKKMDYVLNMSDEKKVDIEAAATNEFATINGNGTFDLSAKNNNFVFPIIVTSESGANKIYTITLKRNMADDGIDKNLDSVVLKDNNNNTLLFDFDPNTYEYDIDIATKITSLSIVPTLKNSQTSFVKDFGNQSIKINDGENIILVKIISQSGQIRTYIFNITKPLRNKSNNSYLQSLKIKGYNLSFSKKVRKYTLLVDKGTTKLNIDATAENEKANVSITGNTNLKKGSIIRIVVTAENESKNIYQIIIDYKPFNYKPYILIIIILIIVWFIYSSRKKQPRTIVISKKEEKSKIENSDSNKAISKPVKKTITAKSMPSKKTASKKAPAKKSTSGAVKKKVQLSSKKSTNTKKKKPTKNKKATKSKRS